MFKNNTNWVGASFDAIMQYAMMDRDQTDFIAVGKFGQNLSLASDTEEDIWSVGGVKDLSVTADTLDIVSSNANDTWEGTGAQLVKVEGLDENYALQEEFVTMNGTTEVVTTSQWIRVHRATVVFAGSGRTNAGNITLNLTTGGAARALISTGLGITQQSHYMVPAGYTGYILSQECSVYRTSGGSGTKSAEITGKFFNVAGNMILNLGIVSVSSGTVYREFTAPARIPEKSEYWYSATAAANGTAASVRWNMICIKNTLLRNPP